MMSTRYNKQTPADFGLVFDPERCTYTKPDDDSQWLSGQLYDLGWGQENGYYRLPLPQYSQLLELVINSADEEDMYGAAAIILQRYPDALLRSCEEMLDNQSCEGSFKKLVQIFGLETGMNRCEIVGKSTQEVQDDYNRWMRISEVWKARSQKQRKKSIFHLWKRNK